MKKRIATVDEFCDALEAKGLQLFNVWEIIVAVCSTDTEEEAKEILGLAMDLLPSCKTEQELESKMVQLLDSEEWKKA